MTPTNPPAIVTKAEYARMRDLSDTYVSRLGKVGRLQLTDDGKVIVAATDALIAQHRDPTRGGDRSGKRERHPAGAGESQPVAHSPAAPRATNAGLPLGTLSLQDIIRLEKLEKLRQTRRENALEEGMLVRRDEVEAEAFARARQAQEALMAIPDRLAAQLAGENDPAEVFALLDAELRRVIATIANFGRDAAATGEASA